MNSKDFKDKVVSLSVRIYPMVARMLGNKEGAEDAIQEIMIKLWDNRRNLMNHPNITGFVFLTARNYCLDILKKKYPEMESFDLHYGMLEKGISENEIEWKELNVIVGNILKELPEQQREIMILRDLDGLEYNEISEITKLNIEHIRVLLSRARKQVSIKLKKIYSYE
jgi:RNA polymerase sigma factor (sigma-70 family)